jgi:N-acetylmuramoyl-L-alanine amidase
VTPTSLLRRGTALLALAAFLATSVGPATAAPRKKKGAPAATSRKPARRPATTTAAPTTAGRPDAALFIDAKKALNALEASPRRRTQRSEWERVALRYRTVLARYPQSSYSDDALLAIGDIYGGMATRFKVRQYEEDARDAYGQLVAEYPSSPLGEDALFKTLEIAKGRGSQRAIANAGRAYLEAFPEGRRAREVKGLLRAGGAVQGAALPAPPPPGLAQVFNLRFWSGDASTRVVLDVEKQVQIHYDRISNPDRLWVDLEGTRLHPNLQGRSFPVGDGLLEKVRIGQNKDSVVRVVLDFKEVKSHSVFYLENPTRLVVDVQAPPRPQMASHVVTPAMPSPVPVLTPPPTPAPTPAASPAGRPVPSPAATVQPTPGPRVAAVRREIEPFDLPSPIAAAPTPKPSPTPAPAASPTSAPTPTPAPSAPAGPAVLAGAWTRGTPSVVVQGPGVAPRPETKREADARKKREREEAKRAAKAEREAKEAREREAKEAQKLAAKATPPSPNPVKLSAWTVHPPGAAPSPSPNAPPRATGEAAERTQRRIPARGEEGEEPQVAQASGGPTLPLPPQANRAGSYSLARQLGLRARKIVIDAGHGGHDPGSIGRGGLQEKDLVLDVAQRVERMLRAELGAEVLMTRSTDVFVPLEERTAVANAKGADLFLSIHANSSRNSNARGIETYFLNFAKDPHAEAVAARENAISAATMKDLQNLVKAITLNSKVDESRDFAASIQEAMLGGVREVVPQMPNRGVRTAPFYVLIGANMPSILAEIAFVSNPEEEKLLRKDEHREKIAASLVGGVRAYLETLNRGPLRQLTGPAQRPKVAARGSRR